MTPESELQEIAVIVERVLRCVTIILGAAFVVIQIARYAGVML